MVPPLLIVPKVTGVVGEPLHNSSLAGWFTCPVGFTVMVKVLVEPVQLVPPLVKVGVTTIVAITGAIPMLTAVNEAILPVPDDTSPMPGVSLLQAYVVVPPVLVVVKVTEVVAELLHTISLDG